MGVTTITEIRGVADGATQRTIDQETTLTVTAAEGMENKECTE
jgi:hypothetical protein